MINSRVFSQSLVYTHTLRFWLRDNITFVCQLPDLDLVSHLIATLVLMVTPTKEEVTPQILLIAS